MTDYCLRYCSFTKEQAATFQFNIQDIVCLKELDAVLQCMQEGVGMYRETTDMSNRVYRRECVCTGKPLTCLIMYTGGSGYVQGNH